MDWTLDFVCLYSTSGLWGRLRGYETLAGISQNYHISDYSSFPNRRMDMDNYNPDEKPLGIFLEIPFQNKQMNN